MVPDHIVGFMEAAAAKSRYYGAAGMTTDVLASICLLIGLSGQCMQDQGPDSALAHELIKEAQHLAERAGVKLGDAVGGGRQGAAGGDGERAREGVARTGQAAGLREVVQRVPAPG
jgi:hypothetical protein